MWCFEDIQLGEIAREYRRQGRGLLLCPEWSGKTSTDRWCLNWKLSWEKETALGNPWQRPYSNQQEKRPISQSREEFRISWVLYITQLYMKRNCLCGLIVYPVLVSCMKNKCFAQSRHLVSKMGGWFISDLCQLKI